MKTSVILILFIIFNAVAGDNIVGKINYYPASEDETLYDIAKKFEVGIEELKFANPEIDTWIPSTNVDLLIPSMHIIPSKPYKDIIINRAEFRLYFFPIENDMANLVTFPVGIGIYGNETGSVI
jgi:L,D-transpeptidase ErfK/SrfK